MFLRLWHFLLCKRNNSIFMNPMSYVIISILLFICIFFVSESILALLTIFLWCMYIAMYRLFLSLQMIFFHFFLFLRRYTRKIFFLKIIFTLEPEKLYYRFIFILFLFIFFPPDFFLILESIRIIFFFADWNSFCSVVRESNFFTVPKHILVTYSWSYNIIQQTCHTIKKWKKFSSVVALSFFSLWS